MGPGAHAAQGDPLSTSAAIARPAGHRPSTPPLDAPALAALVRAAQENAPHAFEDLVRATYGDVFSLALRLLGNEEDACDVVQEAYIRAYRGLARFRGDAAVGTWLYRITANCASSHRSRLQRLRRHNRLDDAASLPDTRPVADPEGMATAAMERAEVAAALRSLPARLRAVIVLRDIYDLPHGAIATELGISEGAAKVRLHRARKRLREDLFSRAAGSGGARVSPEQAGCADEAARAV